MLSPITQFRQQYDVGEQIGRGAFAICYKATHKTTRQVVAVKKISFLGEDESTTKAISNEISLLKSITHPNIIKFIAGYSDKNYAIILTEYEQNRDLQHKITHLKRQSKKFTQKQLMWIFHQILQGLAHLHAHNIMHRDIKPSNIFIDGENRVKIGDLGASKIVQELNFTRIGTPYYLPPEIIRHQSYTFSADIWSLGVTLYHLAYLELPFKAGNVIKLGQLIVESEPQYPQNGCSQRVEQAIRRMLVKNQNLRPSAKELLQTFFKEDLSEISPYEITEQIQEQQPQESKEQPCKTVLQFQFVKQEQQYIEKESYINEATGKTITIRKSILENNENEVNIEEEFIKPIPCPKRLTRTRSIENRFFERRMTHVGKELIDQNESTIVLTVNPMDSRHQSAAVSQKKTFFSNESIPQLGHYKKSSCFKDCVKNETPNTSNFCEFKVYEKNRESTYGHKREPSAIQKRQKHSELMQKIKPLKTQGSMRPEEWQTYEQGKQVRQGKEGRVKVTVDVPSFVVLR